MHKPLPPHRLANGMIDFDFYRHAAARRRRRLQRRALRSTATALRSVFRRSLAPLFEGSPWLASPKQVG
jgi:hypothetical protein